MITVRRAELNDVERFQEIRLKALRESPDAFGSTYAATLKRDDASWRLQLESTTTGDLRNMQFAFDGDACIGIAALYREGNALSGDIIQMWVDPTYRGSQAAATLVRSLLEWAKTAGFHAVNLNVTDTNRRAIQFYRNCGFELTGEVVEIDLARNLQGVRMTMIV